MAAAVLKAGSLEKSKGDDWKPRYCEVEQEPGGAGFLTYRQKVGKRELGRAPLTGSRVVRTFFGARQAFTITDSHNISYTFAPTGVGAVAEWLLVLEACGAVGEGRLGGSGVSDRATAAAATTERQAQAQISLPTPAEKVRPPTLPKTLTVVAPGPVAPPPAAPHPPQFDDGRTIVFDGSETGEQKLDRLFSVAMELNHPGIDAAGVDTMKSYVKGGRFDHEHYIKIWSERLIDMGVEFEGLELPAAQLRGQWPR